MDAQLSALTVNPRDMDEETRTGANAVIGNFHGSAGQLTA